MGLFVIDEEDNETLLLHRISSDDIYRKQEGSSELFSDTRITFFMVWRFGLLCPFSLLGILYFLFKKKRKGKERKKKRKQPAA